MNHAIRLHAIAVAVACGLAAGARAQSVPHVALSHPDESFPESFSSIAGLRELPDGRAIVTDRLEKTVRLVDFAAGTYTDLGHVGSGPGEFQIPGDLFAWPGDSTLMVDFGNTRLTWIDPQGRLTHSTGMLVPDLGFVKPDAVDSVGRIIFESMRSLRSGASAQPPDSIAISRWDPASNRVDTVASLPRPEMSTVTMGGGRGTVRFSGPGAGLTPYDPRNDWAATRDDRVLLAYPEPYHVEWALPAGRRLVGPTVEYDPVPVTDADKKEAASRSGGSVVMLSSGGGSQPSRSMTIPAPNPDKMSWPKVKAPFTARGTRIASDGTAWVQRQVRHGDPVTYDVFDPAGRRIRQVILPEDRALVGFGSGTIYLARTDADDLQWLERYRLP